MCEHLVLLVSTVALLWGTSWVPGLSRTRVSTPGPTSP